MLSRRVFTQTPATPRSDTPVSASGISPQDDNVCIVGTSSGHVFAPTVGAPLPTYMIVGNIVARSSSSRT